MLRNLSLLQKWVWSYFLKWGDNTLFFFLQLEEKDYRILGTQWKVSGRSWFESPSKRYLNFENTPRSICQTQTYKVINAAQSHTAETLQTSEYRTASLWSPRVNPRQCLRWTHLCLSAWSSHITWRATLQTHILNSATPKELQGITGLKPRRIFVKLAYTSKLPTHSMLIRQYRTFNSTEKTDRCLPKVVIKTIYKTV